MGELPKPLKSVRITDSKTFVYQPFFLNVEDKVINETDKLPALKPKGKIK